MSDNTKIKVLHYIYGLHVGGAETFILNTINALDTETYDFDIAIQDSIITSTQFNQMIGSGEIRIINLPLFPSHIFGQYRALRRLLTKHHYDVVHIHINSAINPVPLLIARALRKSTTRFIVHSHNSSNNAGGIIGQFIHYANSRCLITKSTIKIACSNKAARWMFGKHDFRLLANAVDTKCYKFDETSRKEIRRQLSIPLDAEVIGSVARFVPAKNHNFMVELFARYHQAHPQSILLLVGAGPLLDETKSLVDRLGLESCVIFTGLRNDIPDLLSAMDCFFIPSHFEGLAFTAIEAQASGLRVVASSSITSEIDCGKYVDFLSLNDSSEQWIAALEQSIDLTVTSDRKNNPVADSVFDIDRMVTHIDNIYRKSAI